MSEKTCQLTGKEFRITELEKELCRSFEIPLPVLCPEERFRRLASFRNGKQLFLRSCDATGAKLFSAYTPDAPFPVYSEEHWRSNTWDPFQFGQVFEFKRLFVEQLLELWRKVPRPAVRTRENTKCRIVHRVERCESGFLLFDSRGSAHCLYGTGLVDSTRCVDGYQLKGCSDCYECALCDSCERAHFCTWCSRCTDSLFLTDCEDCKSCLFCVGLRGKEYHLFNKPVSKDELDSAIAELSLHARPLLEAAKNRYSDFLAEHGLAHLFARGTTDGSGNYLASCKRCVHCFELSTSSDSANCHTGRTLHGCYDSVGLVDCARVAQSIGLTDCKNVINSVECSRLVDSSYSAYCEDSSNLFGCVALRGKEYCIFNTQLTKEEYTSQMERITKHLKDRNIWGTPLPLSFAEFPYNYSLANEHMPLTKIPAKMMGFAWDDTDRVLRPSELLGESDAPPEELYSEVPERIDGYSNDELCGSVFLCSITGKPYQFVSDEVSFYRQLSIAPPSICFQQRHLERLSRITPHALSERACPSCGEAVRTALPAKWKSPLHHVGCSART